MKKILSFSLYGNKPIFNVGCIENAKLHKKYFTDWVMRVYCNHSVPEETLTELKKYDVEIVILDQDTNYFASMWRFHPYSEPGVSHFISRDADSRISKRDECAVNQWIESKKEFHIIRDHPVGHGWVINAGMWGCVPNPNENIIELINNYININNTPEEKSIDQRFLKDIIYPKINNSNLFLNDEYFNYEGIGVKIDRERELDNYQFIGEPINSKNMLVDAYRDSILPGWSGLNNNKELIGGDY